MVLKRYQPYLIGDNENLEVLDFRGIYEKRIVANSIVRNMDFIQLPGFRYRLSALVALFTPAFIYTILFGFDNPLVWK